jgi:3-oxoacyl-[acyl-carrier protein] reductase
MFDLNGKKALITGASGGIGQSIAQAFYKQGATVALAGRNKDALEKLAATMPDKARVHVITGDLASAETADKLLTDAETAMGGIDVLINNAGLTKDTLALRMTDDAWQQVIDVNLTAAFRLSRAVLKGMMKQRFGRIINITSIVGVTGNPGQTNYAASKAGLIGMSKSLAAEVASRGITVNCIAPGFIATAMTDALTDDQKSKMLVNIPAGKLGSPDDIAASAVYLASDEAAYVTGQTIHVNGGMAMI